MKSAGLSLIHERVPSGTSEVRHYHLKARQFFFVLSGTVTLEVGGRREMLGRHEGLEVPPCVTHQISNESKSEVEFLVLSHPPGHGDRVSAIVKKA
jgi:mannose-6-phosphate isomerase-like protein (cupin superfamily)